MTSRSHFESCGRCHQHPCTCGRRIPGRAHTPEEKRAMLDRIFAAWSTPGFDKLRLGQLLVNALGSDMFAAEDAQLVEAVENLIARR